MPHAAGMADHDPKRFTAARRALEEYVRRESPQTWRVLEDPEVGFSHMAEALVFHFLPSDRDVFETITLAPSLEILKRAAQAARYNVKLTCGAQEVLIDAT
jgi:hypothetical protein